VEKGGGVSALSWQRESFMTLVACVSAICFVAYPVDLTLLNPVFRLIRNIPGSSVFSARGDVAALGTIKSDWKGMLASRTTHSLHFNFHRKRAPPRAVIAGQSRRIGGQARFHCDRNSCGLTPEDCHWAYFR
jgi:hypothetical protein